MPRTPPQHLLIDADDTLWENHRYFLEALTAFLDILEERGHRREAGLRILREIEAIRTHTVGYGSQNYARSLVATVARLEGACPQPLADELLQLGDWIFHHPIEVFPGVAETLDDLRGRHDLLLVTKGQHDEQSGKIARSGLALFFRHVEIMPEKEVVTYRALCRDLELDANVAWMVGNSPRSDINPARHAGLRTVFIPHRTIWELEDADFATSPDLHLARFRELSMHF